MTTNGRTIWWPKDAAWWRRERIVALGEEFGADGPAVVDWLSCEAKVQNDSGWVKAGPRTISRGCFVGFEVVCHVLSRAVTLGLLDDYIEDAGIITCRISGFTEDGTRGGAALRQQEKRRREAETSADCHASSRAVTPRHDLSPKRREEKRTTEERTNDRTTTDVRAPAAASPKTESERSSLRVVEHAPASEVA